MTARSPPARPHLYSSSAFSSRDNNDWGEEDAWDSASDSGSPVLGSWTKAESSINSGIKASRKGSLTTTSRTNSSSDPLRGVSSTAPRDVPKPSRDNDDSSSSTLALSYTHLSAPHASSYPPKNGWTIVRRSGERTRRNAYTAGDDQVHDENTHPRDDDDVEGDLILGNLDPEPGFAESFASLRSKAKQDVAVIRDDLETIVNDPLAGIRHIDPLSASSNSHSQISSEKAMREDYIRANRRQKFVDCLSLEDVSMAQLRKIAWSGIPEDMRPAAWQLLLGYLPLPSPLRSSTLARKRSEYQSLVEVAFARDRQGLDQQIWHQIEIDVPRTRPGVLLWMHGTTQRSLERILYVWAIRHPASGYVQGINDLATPFFQVFLSAYIDTDPETCDPGSLPKYALDAIEADTFWCLSKLLDGIQDNYIFAQPGIQRSVRRMAELVARIDAPLAAHLDQQNVEFMQFAFRWMNCLLMREMSVRNTIRMWDTYLAEGTDAFSQFHLYVCSAFLVKWSDKLREMDFQGIIMFLQSLPTQNWGDHEVEMLLSEAFVLNSIWENAQSHFNAT